MHDPVSSLLASTHGHSFVIFHGALGNTFSSTEYKRSCFTRSNTTTSPLPSPSPRNISSRSNALMWRGRGVGVESDPVQPQRLHAPSVRHELYRDSAGADPRELPHPPHLLLRPPLLRGGAAARVQALLAHHQAGRTGATGAFGSHLSKSRATATAARQRKMFMSVFKGWL